MSNEILAELQDVFPTENFTVPYIEMKFRLAGKYGEDKLEEVLLALIEKGVLVKFEFNNSIQYKSKKEIPITLGKRKSAAAGKTPDQLTELSKIVIELAKDNPNLADMVKSYQEKYKI